MEPLIALERKTPLPLENDYTKCLVCQSVRDDKGRMQKLTTRGLSTFKNAIEIRKDEVYHRLWSDIQNSDDFPSKSPMCHETCRSEYTHKRSLDEFMSTTLAKEDQEHGEASSGASVGDRRSASEFRKTPSDCVPVGRLV